jgi:bifunctional non-homologous end joining protein LigD
MNMKKLKTYSSKRDFTKTSEPSGIGKMKRTKSAIFVVQEHHASRLYYDFRLEMDGVLKSWAIPKGQYGAGDVYIWDKGTWQPENDAYIGLKNGKLEFTLKGKKLKGDFVLLRINNRAQSQKHNWLLMKKIDKEADFQFEICPIVETR